MEGFRAAITATVSDLGDADTPPLLAVKSIELSSDNPQACGVGATVYVPPYRITSGSLEDTYNLHASLMLVSWGWMLPSGVAIARLFRHRDPIWFQIHRACQVLGLILAIIGWSIALRKFDVFSDPGISSYTHGVFGCATMAIGLIQPLNAVIRPHKPQPGESASRVRRVWEIIHKGSGYVAVVLSIITIAMGTKVIPRPETGKKFQAAYGAGLGGTLLILVIFSCFDKKKCKGNETEEPEKKGEEEEELTGGAEAQAEEAGEANKKGEEDEELADGAEEQAEEGA